VKALESELTTANHTAQIASRDDLIKQLQDQVSDWRTKYEELAKLYTSIRTEYFEFLGKSKAKDLDLANILSECDQARLDFDKQKCSHNDEINRLCRELSLANERANDSLKNQIDCTTVPICDQADVLEQVPTSPEGSLMPHIHSDNPILTRPNIFFPNISQPTEPQLSKRNLLST
jgi:chromosome segregation ATPase